jgi:hypothetical protein
MRATHILSAAAAAAILSCACASAQAADAGLALPTKFPVKLEHVAPEKGGFWTTGGLKMTWRSAVPGLQFCVAYASTHGVSFHGSTGGRSWQGDREHCLVAGRDGTVSDVVPVTYSDPTNNPDGLLIANVVLIDNEVSTESIPVHQLLAKPR